MASSRSTSRRPTTHVASRCARRCETAASWGLTLEHAVPGGGPVIARVIDAADTQLQIRAIKTWLPISQFINAMARSLGAHDSYPFVMPNPVLDKLAFIHQVIGSGVRGETPMNFSTPAVAKVGKASRAKNTSHDPH